MLKTPHQPIRQQVANVLTALFGNRDEGILFLPENTKKRTGGGKKHSINTLKTSQSWTARSNGNKTIMVSCIGMTMTEFLKEFKHKNIYYQFSGRPGFLEVSIYRNNPEWETNGYVVSYNKGRESITLHFSDLILMDEVETRITPETPKWLVDTPPNQHAAFSCKIYQGWRSLKTIDGFDWSKVWKTFQFNGYFPYGELCGFI